MFTRRSFLTQSLLASAALQFQNATTVPATPVVHTADGKLRGLVKGGVHVFRGVPFAHPPVGALRFRPPQPVQPWTGVREAIAFSAAPVQPGEATIAQSEDCLYLNVWAPPEPGSHPVFVWIHGGGFTGGHSFDPLFDGTRFAQAGIVCVTIAYRLGAFGFLDLGELGHDYAGGANHALQDVVAALRWVQMNIASFGGNPKLVTLGGESAGAKMTDMLMGVPSAEPLFHQMISESGGAERIFPQARAREVAKGFCAQWTKAHAQPCSALLTAPAREIIAVQEQFVREWPVHFPLRAEIDGAFIPKPPLVAIWGGSTKRKRLLIGTNRDESALFLGPHPKADPTARDLGNLSETQFALISAKYRQIYPGMDDELRRIRSVTAEEYWIPSLRVAEAHVQGGGEAYMYLLAFPASHGRWAGYAFHAYDLRFVWDQFGTETPTEEEMHLAQVIHASWVAFIRGDAPHAPGLPNWPAYSLRSREAMVFDRQNRVENDPQQAERKAWDGLLVS